jgi:hypothetical protein
VSLIRRVGAFGSVLLERFGDFYFGIVAFALGSLFVFWGGRGAVAYTRGVRAAWSEPWVDLIGLGAGAWMLLMSIRLFRGPGAHRQSLLSPNEMLVLSLGALIGSIWAFTYAPNQAISFALISLAGLGRWWALRRGDEI